MKAIAGCNAAKVSRVGSGRRLVRAAATIAVAGGEQKGEREDAAGVSHVVV